MVETAANKESVRAMRAAFVVTSHADVPQLERLVRVILRGAAQVRVYISHDERGESGVERIAGDRCRVLRERGGRGDFTQIERILSLFQQVESDGGADFVAVISGADYPARPIEEFLTALEASGDGMLHHFSALRRGESDWGIHEARQRYLYRWRIFGAVDERQRARWHWLHGVNYLQPLVRVNLAYGSLRVGAYRGRLPRGLTCYGGSAWFSLSWRAVQHVLDVTRSREDIMRWGRESLAIDEVFFQSILLTAGRFSFVNDNGRYIDFSADGFGHPKVLTDADAAEIDRSGAYFVRKVDSRRSAALLGRLDRRIATTHTAAATDAVADREGDAGATREQFAPSDMMQGGSS